jgi:hypothetical protein
VSGGDVTDQGLTAEAYPISGRVTDGAAAGVKNTPISLTGTNGSVSCYTGDDGTYGVYAPNGAYTLQATSCDLLGCLSFMPVDRTVTVDHAGLTGQDFTEQ